MTTFKPFVSTDKFSMANLNNKFEEVVADFNAKIDAALGALPQLVFGTYTGDGTASRTIELGFTPKALIVTDSRGGFFRFSSDLGRIFGGIVFPGKPARDGSRTILAICDNGFQVYKDTITPYASTNYSGEEYRYIAIK